MCATRQGHWNRSDRMNGVRRKVSQTCQPAAAALALGLLLVPGYRVLGADAYLAVIGPAPLRFALPQRPGVAQPDQPSPGGPATSQAPEAAPVAQPQPQAPEPAVDEPTPSVEPPNAAGIPAADTASAPAAPETDTVGAAGATPPVAPQTGSADGTPLITPQVLVEYFSTDPTQTNRQVAVVTSLPDVKFTPPVPRELPGSRATYKSE